MFTLIWGTKKTGIDMSTSFATHWEENIPGGANNYRHMAIRASQDTQNHGAQKRLKKSSMRSCLQPTGSGGGGPGKKEQEQGAKQGGGSDKSEKNSPGPDT